MFEIYGSRLINALWGIDIVKVYQPRTYLHGV